ncbi:hypothetical protein [Actinomycetospora soli]|uniref:hypothetical protein n=1 Tax=Actinomycetospora soli TaxID=2893887 RepID=UPI001E46D692|nr:hypothetical protein [Actinomycetospora soli]MCD2187018.1 hypothetical protein [Actinomycetospora soli]
MSTSVGDGSETSSAQTPADAVSSVNSSRENEGPPSAGAGNGAVDTTDGTQHQGVGVVTGSREAGHVQPDQDSSVTSHGDSGREVVSGWVSTRRGRWAISAFLIVLLAAVLSINMPTSALKSLVAPWTYPALATLGLNQTWGVFSPDPRADTSFVIARVVYLDGTIRDRGFDVDRGAEALRDYRWRKYEEQLWAGRQARAAWLPYARWLTASDRAEGRPVREVQIIKRTRTSLPPGPGPDYGPWKDEFLGRVMSGDS